MGRPGRFGQTRLATLGALQLPAADLHLPILLDLALEEVFVGHLLLEGGVLGVGRAGPLEGGVDLPGAGLDGRLALGQFLTALGNVLEWIGIVGGGGGGGGDDHEVIAIVTTAAATINIYTTVAVIVGVGLAAAVAVAITE